MTQNTERISPDLIKLAAAITSAPRWVIALMPADGTAMPWAHEAWWLIVSAFFSVAFSLVEVYAAAYMMRAWRETKSDAQAKNLLVLWVSTLIVLVIVLVPPLYTNAIGLSIKDMHPLVVLLWITCVAASTFVVIGGIGYADKSHRVIDVSKPKTETTTATVTRQPATDDAPVTHEVTREEFLSRWNEGGHDSIAPLAKAMHVEPRKAQRWVEADRAKKETA